MLERSESDEIRTVIVSLEDEFGTEDEDVRRIQVVVEREYSQYQSARVRTFVPTLVHRNARAALRRLTLP